MKQYQNVTIVLDNGKRGTFTGSVLVSKKDQKKGVRIIEVLFNPPEELPAGCTLEVVERQVKK